MAEPMDVDLDDNKNVNKDPSSNVQVERKISPKQQKRLDYLLEQAEIFSHFVGNSPKQKKRSARQEVTRAKNDTNPSNARRRAPRSKEELDDSEDDDGQTGVRFETTPSYITGVMRDYQLRGLNWLISLYESNVNGILADEMGLGKTLQTISMLGFLKVYKKINGPFFVVGPKSTLRNWYNEVNRFCPTLKPVILIGEKKARDETLENMKDQSTWDVCLTTYEMVLSEKSALKKYRWQYLVVDEAHRLKNENSKLSTILRTFKSTSRLLLTGTPLQNNLHELWALLNFLLPDVFVSAEDFDTWFDSDDCLRGNHDIVHRLRAILKPFMLRRIKAEVEKSLLPKIEVKLFVGLTELQRDTYKKVLAKEITKLNPFGEESSKAVNNILMELRKVANHPYLIENVEPGPPYTTDEHLVHCCGKMMVLDKLLTKLKLQGSRVVLFSQFVIMLDILEDYMTWRGHEFRRLDGNTPYEDRATNIDEFNAENSNIFVYIISTRAGGLGINLATADTVVIYDSDWNPQPDFQAIDRVHRIGQTKQVRIFRLVTENTVDERIVQRAEIKTRLDKMIIQQGRNVDKNINEMTKGMKRDMIRFGAEHIMSSTGPSVIDVDIDKILKEGAIKTAEENDKYAQFGEGELRNLTLEEASSVSLYQFEGIDHRTLKKQSDDQDLVYTFRQRKTVQYAPVLPLAPAAPPRNMQCIYDFQFYPRELWELCEEYGWLNFAEDKERKEELMAQGFPSWKRVDLKTFVDAMVRHGRDNVEQIATMLPHKAFDEVARYHKTFWSRGEEEIKSFEHCILPLKRQAALKKKEEGDKAKQQMFSQALDWKLKSCSNPQADIPIKYVRTDQYTKEQDQFILNALVKHGIDNPDVYHLIRRDISVSKRLNFDWFLRSRKVAELKNRGHHLLYKIQREYAEKLVSDIVSGTNKDIANDAD